MDDNVPRTKMCGASSVYLIYNDYEFDKLWNYLHS